MTIPTFIKTLTHIVPLELANPKWSNIMDYLVINKATPCQVDKVAEILLSAQPSFNDSLFKKTIEKKLALHEKYRSE